MRIDWSVCAHLSLPKLLQNRRAVTPDDDRRVDALPLVDPLVADFRYESCARRLPHDVAVGISRPALSVPPVRLVQAPRIDR